MEIINLLREYFMSKETSDKVLHTFRVSKVQVVEAVLNEPLEGGRFFNTLSGVADTACPVCAVGAVLRKAGCLPSALGLDSMNLGDHVTKGLYGPEEIDRAYASGNFLSILSCEFERANYAFMGRFSNTLSKKELIELRFHLLNVIEAHCPPYVEFSV